MPRVENLADLMTFSGKFGGKGAPDTDGAFGFHQGKLIAWDSATGRNTVRVLGTTVNDLPMLSMADSILLAEGDTVGILRFRQTYFMLGRITPPGAPPRPVFQAAGDTVEGFSLQVPSTEVVGYDYVMPDWASNVVIMASVNGRVKNNSGGLDNINHYIEVGGAGSFGTAQAVPDTYWQGIPDSFTVGGPVAPGTKIRVSFKISTATRSWPYFSGNKAYLTSTAIFGNT